MDTSAARAPSSPPRLIEVLAPLSLVTDLGMGAPDEQAMRACLLATGLARQMHLPEPEVAHVYYATLLEHLGCTATASEEARRLGGDELATRPLVSHADMQRGAEMLSVMRSAGRGRPPLVRMRIVIGLFDGFRWAPGVQAAVCEVATLLAARLGLGQPVQAALGQMFERWDGKGEPQRLRGEAIVVPARFAQAASRATALHALGGADAAVAGVRASSGGWIDPEIASAFEAHGPAMLAEIDAGDVMAATIAAEPAPHLRIERSTLDEAARAFGDMVDLQSSFTLGHSGEVARLAEGAADALGLSVGECVTLRRAGLLHDLGRAGVPAGAWEQRRPLSAAQQERIRLHAYYTERILARSAWLEEAAAIAGRHHERLDGSGYHRGAGGRNLSLSARILATADAYQGWTQERPHRPALSREEAAERLAGEARAGRFDPQVAEAVLGVAGAPRTLKPPEAPAGLSDREIEVLRLLAAGCTNREIAEELVISTRTAEHHVQHIYAKIGVSTRPGATLFALEHDLTARWPGE